MTDKSCLRDTINVCIDVQIPGAVNVEVVQCDKDAGILPVMTMTTQPIVCYLCFLSASSLLHLHSYLLLLPHSSFYYVHS